MLLFHLHFSSNYKSVHYFFLRISLGILSFMIIKICITLLGMFPVDSIEKNPTGRYYL